MHSESPDFSDLDTDLDQVEIDPSGKQPSKTFLEAQFEHAPAAARYESKQAFAAVYPCERCSGSGRKLGGVCYRCNGTGKQNRKPVDRSPQAIQKRAETKARKEERKADDRAAYIKEYAHVFDWIKSKASVNSFAYSLFAGFERYGSLTERQIDAVERAIVEDERREQERKDRAMQQILREQQAQPIFRQVSCPEPKSPTPDKGNRGVDLRNVPDGRYAVPGGDTRLKVLIKKPLGGKWSSWIFVSDAAEYGQRRRYGMQGPLTFYHGEIQDELRIIAADPKAAAVAYGRLTGTCCICGRTLEDPASVEAGIGPVCAKRFS